MHKNPSILQVGRTGRTALATAAFAIVCAPLHSATISWNMNTAAPSSINTSEVTGGTITQFNNNGTTTLITTTSPSSGYAGASGTNNAGAAARVGVLNTGASGSVAFEFTLTPAAGFSLSFTDLLFGSRSTGTGPQAWSLRSSADAYAADIVTGALLANSTWALQDAAAFTFNTPSAVTFRLFGYNGAGSPAAGTANWRIDDMQLVYTAISSTPSLYWDLNGATAGIGGTGTWDTTSSNWNLLADGTGAPQAFTSANPAIFGGTAGTVTVATGGVTANGGITFETAGYTVDGDPLTIGLSGIATNHASGTTTISAALAGSVGVSKSGAGTLALTGANTFTGNAAISAGAIEIDGDASLGATANDVVLSSGKLVATDTISLDAGRDITGTGGLEAAATKTLTVNGVTNISGLTLSGTGTVALAGATAAVGTLTVSDAATLTAVNTVTATTIASTNTAGTATVTANLDLGSATRTVTVADGSAAVDLVLDGTVAIAGGTNNRLHKLGAGTLRLGGVNTGLTGSVRLGTAGTTPAAGGRLVITNKDALGSGASLLVQFNDGILEATTALTGANAIALGLSIGAGQGVPATFNGSAMEFTGATSLFKPASTSFQHKIALNTDVTFTGAFGASSSTGTSTGLLLSGTGSLTLANPANGHEIATIVEGPTFAVNGSLVAPVTVNSGALEGTGSIAGAVVIGEGTGEDDALLAPGNSVGTLTVASLSLASDAVFTLELDSSASVADKIVANGLISIGVGAELTVSDLGAAVLLAGTEFTIVQNDSVNAGDTTGTFDGLADLAQIVAGSNTYEIDYGAGSNGNDVLLRVVPEPGSFAALLGGATLLSLVRRRRS